MAEQTKRKTGIRRKITLMIFLCVSITTIIGAGLGYKLGFNLIRNTIGNDHVNMAKMLSQAINRIISEEILDIKIHMSTSLYINEIEKYNLTYEGMDKAAIQKHFNLMEEKWRNTSDSSLIRKYLNSPASKRLKIAVEEDRGISELFITDGLGGLVASSGKTSDFYQADEGWWQGGFADGKGNIFIDDITFDELSNVLSLPLAFPVKSGSGEIIGVCKAVLDIDRLFTPLENFKIGNTGHAVLVDGKGYILFHKGVEPLSTIFVGKEDFHKLSKSDSGWMIVKNPRIHKELMFIAWALVDHPKLAERRVAWRTCVDQDPKEVFAPLNKLLTQAIIVIFVILVVMVIIGFVFGGIFVKPIKKLHEATNMVAKGDLDYKVEINTSDEIEQFADSFNVMTDNLKKTTTSIDNLNREINERKKAEEKLRQAKEYSDLLFSLAPSGIFTVDKDCIITSWNKRAEQITGYSPAEILGKKCTEFALYPCSEMCELYSGKIKKPIINKEREIRRKGGKKLIILKNATLLKDAKDNIIGGIENFEDITERKRLEEKLENLSLVDELTGLHNKRGFLMLAEQQMKISERHRIGLALIFMDLDNMKEINDTMGHVEGDKALIDIASILRDTSRKSDVIARMGGDEFIILTVNMKESNPEFLISRLKENIESYNEKTLRLFKLSVSSGMAEYDPENPCSVNDLIDRADKMMYEQKQAKKKK